LKNKNPQMNNTHTESAMVRARLLAMHFHAKVGHVGGNLSSLDALIVLFHKFLGDNDRFVLSKGHSAGALYATLWSLGKISDEDLNTFCKDNSKLPGHPSGNGIPGLMFPTGSLGHGPSLCAGLALAAKKQKSSRRVFCLCSDGEWQEGSCWEALIFAVHNRLDNLTILIDQNKLQGFGTTEEVISCGDLQPRLSAFGANVISCDGHNQEAISGALESLTTGPKIILLNTKKGRGTLFENKLESHYLPLTPENFEFSITQISKEGAP
jgi:transketolase